MQCLIEKDTVTLVNDKERWSKEDITKLYKLYCGLFKDKDVIILHKGTLKGRRTGNEKVWGVQEHHFQRELGDNARKEFLNDFQNKREFKMK